MKLQKFENVDVIASLEAIMKQNTAFYQSDFDIDKQILRKAAVSLIPEDKRLLWFSRPSGLLGIFLFVTAPGQREGTVSSLSSSRFYLSAHKRHACPPT
jgi:hypothetical protein